MEGNSCFDWRMGTDWNVERSSARFRWECKACLVFKGEQGEKGEARGSWGNSTSPI